MLTGYTQRMRFVDQQIRAVFVFHSGDIRQRCPIPQHAVNTLDYNQGVGGTITEPLKPLFQIAWVIVSETNNLSAAQTAAIINARMAVRVYQQDVARPCQSRQHGQVGNVAGGKYHSVFASEKIGEFLFQLDMAGVGTIRHPGSGRAGAEFPHGIGSRIDTARVKRKT